MQICKYATNLTNVTTAPVQSARDLRYDKCDFDYITWILPRFIRAEFELLFTRRFEIDVLNAVEEA